MKLDFFNETTFLGIIKAFKLMLDQLEPREKAIIKMRFGIEILEPRTLEEVGKEFGVTRERIRQIESRAREKMREFALKDK